MCFPCQKHIEYEVWQAGHGGCNIIVKLQIILCCHHLESLYCTVPYCTLLHCNVLMFMFILGVNYNFTIPEIFATCRTFHNLMFDKKYFLFTNTGCYKTSGKLCKLLSDSFLEVFFLFFCSFDCQIWAIFHSGTLWPCECIFFVENIIMKKCKISGLAQIGSFFPG